MEKVLSLFVILLFSTEIIFAQKYTISGYITDSSSGEPLIGAAAIDKESGLGVVTGNTGYYSLSLEKGNRSIVFSYLGYLDTVREIALEKDITLNIELELAAEQLENALVTAHRTITGARSIQMSAVEIPVSQIKAVPAFGGEVDIIKSIQLLPGVQSGTEASAGMYVRGGGADENLLLMDGVPLYNVNHMLGFFSVFNADAVKNVTLYKGSFPARFGGHLSSVIDVRLNDGNENEIHGNVSVGVLSAKFNLEGPIVKGKTTFNVSARRTYLDLLLKPVLWYANKDNFEDSGNYSKTTGGYGFYDINAKVTHKMNNGDRLSFSFYIGDDNADMGTEDAVSYRVRKWDAEKYESVLTDSWSNEKEDVSMNLKWGNMVSSLKWNHEISPSLYLSSAANITRYRSVLSIGIDDLYFLSENNIERDKEQNHSNLTFDSKILDCSATADFDWRPAPKHDIKFGGSYTYHTFKPGVIAMRIKSAYNGQNTEETSETLGDKPLYSHEGSAFFEDNWSVFPWLKANIGVHASVYGINGKTYYSAEPRISTRVLLSDQISFKASYSEMSQYVHLLCNSNLSLPSDLWVPVTDLIKPMHSRQAAAGLFWDRGGFEFSVEGYYKTMDNVLEYKDGATFFSTSAGWEEKVSMGRGWSYGVELLAQKKLGKTTGWIGYTWSKSMRQFDKPGMLINLGKPFYAKYDRPHDLSLTIAHEFSKKFEMSASFIYASGNRGSLASDYVPAGDIYVGPEAGSFSVTTVSYVPERNNYRMPAYNRADISFTWKKSKKHGTSLWNVSVYNVYNHMNPYLIMTDTRRNYNEETWELISEETYLKQITIFPILPSLSYTFKF